MEYTIIDRKKIIGGVTLLEEIPPCTLTPSLEKNQTIYKYSKNANPVEGKSQNPIPPDTSQQIIKLLEMYEIMGFITILKKEELINFIKKAVEWGQRQ